MRVEKAGPAPNPAAEICAFAPAIVEYAAPRSDKAERARKLARSTRTMAR